MIPSWMIEAISKQRDRERRERPELRIDLPERPRDESRERGPAPSAPIVIELAR